MQFTALTEAHLQPIVDHLIALTKQYKVFTFSGQLGAGKTTLIKHFCKHLGVDENVSSPTFSLVNEYNSTQRPIFHFDFYRIKKAEEAYDIGFEEYIDSGSICLIEWPEMVEPLLPEDAVKITLWVSGQGERTIEIIAP